VFVGTAWAEVRVSLFMFIVPPSEESMGCFLAPFTYILAFWLLESKKKILLFSGDIHFPNNFVLFYLK
jgi:hypothetical protein